MTTSRGQVPGIPGRFRKQIVGCAFSLVAAGLIGWLCQSELVLITGLDNGEIAASSHGFKEDDFEHPRLRLLRSRERLDQVVSAGGSQFGKILLLRAWVHGQWEVGGSFYYPPWDAVEILDLARKFGNRGFCAQYAIVFLQACQSLGLHARYVDLPGHFVVAVWSDDYDRWVVMDPMKDVHYERDGVPMRGRELYRAYRAGDFDGIVQVGSTGRRKAVTRDDLRDYRLYSIGLSADQLTDPVVVKSNGLPRTLVPAADYRTYPKIGRDRLEITTELLAWRSEDSGESYPHRPESGDQDEFQYGLNQTVILLANERLQDRILKVALQSSNSPTFERFLIRSEESTDWVPTTSPMIRWMLHPGLNQLSARVETRYGWRGHASSLRIWYKPPLLGSLPSFRGNVLTWLWHRSM
jgi:transglutaminase superfamily protein